MMRFRIAKFHFAGSADVLVRTEREARNTLRIVNKFSVPVGAPADGDVRAPSMELFTS